MDKLSNRQKKLFKIIVDTYIQAAQPISSKEIIEKHIKDVSSATIRNDMNVLEKMGLLVKTHTSSGRVPTSAGYMYYEKSILEPNINVDVKNKLRKIFNNRELSINTILDQSVEILKESLQLPLVLSSAEDAETLKRFDLIQINNREALVIIVTNNGNVIKNTISFTSDKQFDDIAICIRVFNDRLVDYPISKLKEGILSIKEVIRNMVHEYEFCIRQIVEKLFAANEVFYKQELHGTKYLTHQPEFQDVNKLNKILSFLENTNVWKHIAYNQNTNGKTTITFGESLGEKDLAIASTTINLNNEKKHISVIGPTRMDYSKVQGVLDFIREESKKYVK